MNFRHVLLLNHHVSYRRVAFIAATISIIFFVALVGPSAWSIVSLPGFLGLIK